MAARGIFPRIEVLIKNFTMATVASAHVTEQPPPSYQAAQSTPTSAITEISTLDGKVPVARIYSVTHETSAKVESRKVFLKDGITGGQDFVVTFETHAPSLEVRGMKLHLQESDGPIEASLSVPSADEVLGVVAHGSSKIQVIEHRSKSSIRASQAAAADGDDSKHHFQVGDLTWRVSKKYLHPSKAKSRAGDLELVDREGSVVAVFLNHWSGSPNANDLGQLALTTRAFDGAGSLHAGGPIPLAILSALIVVMHLSYRDRDGAKGFVKDVMQAVALCTVM
jgi:hypothetical protein